MGMEAGGTKERIFDIAVRLIAQNGFESVTMRDIAFFWRQLIMIAAWAFADPKYEVKRLDEEAVRCVGSRICCPSRTRRGRKTLEKSYNIVP